MTLSEKARAALAGHLRREIEGDILIDEYSRGRYATDASPYQTFPAAIVLPKTQSGVTAALRLAWEAGLPVTARGGGTGHAGQAIGEGLILDTSKYLTRLLYYDANAQSCIVEPGITLAALNKAIKPERAWFPIDMASAGQATLGGMMATDAIGGRTLRYGRMRNNIIACDAVLADGSEVSFGEIAEDFGHTAGATEDAALLLDLLEIAESRQELLRSWPRVPGALAGYNAAALLSGDRPANAAAFLAGSEGTLAVFKRIEVKLARRPRSRAMGVCHFPSAGGALRAVPQLLTLGPTNIELTAPRILELGLSGAETEAPARRILGKTAGALLFVEFMEGNRVSNARKLKELADLMARLGHSRGVSEVIGAAAQNAVQRAHNAGLTKLHRLARLPGPFAPVSAIAVPVHRLEEAAEALTAAFARHGWTMTLHGHAGAGVLNLRPWLGPQPPGESGVRAAAEEACETLRGLAADFAATDGHGVARSYLMEALRPKAATALFEEIKARLDPRNKLNPGKIVYPAPPGPEMMRSQAPADGLPQLAALGCDGAGLCRRLDAPGLMCPSFRLTQNERDAPRGRANTLRLALAGAFGPDALGSQEMAETMALCLSCKACRTECPRSVDIAQAKILTQKARLATAGLSRYEKTAAFLPHYAPGMRGWRHILNLRDILPWAAGLSERLTGVSADRPWPHWSGAPFDAGAFAAGDHSGEAGARHVLLFPDTFNSHFDPVTLRAAADVLTASGFRLSLLAPPPGERPYCCGRTFLEAGLVDQASAEGARLIAAARPHIQSGAALVGLEPACLLTLRDEFRGVLALDGADELAAASFLFEEIMSEPGVPARLQAGLRRIEADVLFSGHCHQHAFGTAGLARQLAALVPGTAVTEAEKACCGMGTLFGYRPDAVASSLGMGELSLFPQIRRASRDTLLIADGFACRKQISDGTGRTARHTAVLLKLSLAAKEKFGREADDIVEKNDRLAKRLRRLRMTYFR